MIICALFTLSIRGAEVANKAGYRPVGRQSRYEKRKEIDEENWSEIRLDKKRVTSSSP